MRLVPVTREQHGDKFLRNLTSYAHVAGTAATEIVGGEIGQVAASYPIFFIRQGENIKPVCLFGLSQGENLFVDSTGAWQGMYIPATLRAYPFTFAKLTESGELAVLVDEDSNLLSDSEGEPIFGTSDGEPNGPLARAINLLTQLSAEGLGTVAAANLLNKAGVLRGMTINITRAGAHKDLDGLLTVDEAAVNALPDDQFLELRKQGALTLAYAQILSMGQLARLQAKASAADRGHESRMFS